MEDALATGGALGVIMLLARIIEALVAKKRSGDDGGTADALAELRIADARDHTQIAELLRQVASELREMRAEARATTEALRGLTEAMTKLTTKVAELEERVSALEEGAT